MKYREQKGVLVPERELLVPDKRLCHISMFPFDHGVLSAIVAAAGPAWISMNATHFTLGDTASVSWAGSTVTMNAGDINIRTTLTFIGASQDFDFEATVSNVAANGPNQGFHDNGTTSGNRVPTLVDAVVYARNASTASWGHDNDNPDGAAKSDGWMANKIIKISRRVSGGVGTFYGTLDNVLDKTFAEITDIDAGGLFLGNGGGATGWTFSNVRYRTGTGLPAIT